MHYASDTNCFPPIASLALIRKYSLMFRKCNHCYRVYILSPLHIGMYGDSEWLHSYCYGWFVEVERRVLGRDHAPRAASTTGRRGLLC